MLAALWLPFPQLALPSRPDLCVWWRGGGGQRGGCQVSGPGAFTLTSLLWAQYVLNRKEMAKLKKRLRLRCRAQRHQEPELEAVA